MNTIKAVVYRPSLNETTRVRLHRNGHPQDSEAGVILRALKNPSNRRENQWYDVRFGSGVVGRFLERYLEPVAQGVSQEKEFEGSQTFVA